MKSERRWADGQVNQRISQEALWMTVLSKPLTAAKQYVLAEAFFEVEFSSLSSICRARWSNTSGASRDELNSAPVTGLCTVVVIMACVGVAFVIFLEWPRARVT